MEYVREHGGTTVAYALDGKDNVSCVDIDRCFDENGELFETAKEALKKSGATYAEKSVSGNGLHIFGKTNGMDLRTFSKDGDLEFYQKEQFIAIYEQVLSRNLDTTALESELSDLEAEINIAAELIEECIKENAHVALDQDEYQKRYDALVARFDKAKARHTEVTDLIAERMARKHQIESYLKELRSREPLTEFRETDWLAMVDYITVHSKKDIWATFKDGNEIKA